MVNFLERDSFLYAAEAILVLYLVSSIALPLIVSRFSLSFKSSLSIVPLLSVVS